MAELEEGDNPELVMPQQVEGEPPEADTITSPSKVLRIGSMVKSLLEEIKASNLDEPSRIRLKEIYDVTLRELSSGLSEDLAKEFLSFTFPFDADTIPSEAELRIAQAQIVGWLEGLFQGIQATLYAQQMAARSQLDQMRSRQLPQGAGEPPSLGNYL